VTTIAESIGRQLRMLDAAREWFRARSEYMFVVDEQRQPAEIAPVRQRYHLASARLADAITELENAMLPAAGDTTTGAARRVTQLEGEIVLAAIGWFHARAEDNSETELARAEQLEKAIGELVDRIQIAAGAAG